MSTYGNEIADRYFSDRAYMMLVYPQKGKGGKTKNITSNKKIKIPFYENPIIFEAKSSRLSQYKLLGRNSELYSYLGADSRTISIDMGITLHHLFAFMKSAPWTDSSKTMAQTPKFEFLRRDAGTKNPYTKDKQDGKATSLARKSSDAQLEANDKQGQGGLVTKESIFDFVKEYESLSQNDELSVRASGDPQAVRASYLYYINLLRSCVLGSEELGLGPPIIRLNYGPLYKDVPLIANKYDLEADQAAGIDAVTLLPRMVRFKLDLVELRLGDFSTHAPEKYGQSDDNVPTWESVINYGTIDPRIDPLGLNPPQQFDFTQGLA